MITAIRNVKLRVTEQELLNAIQNAEIAGFVLKGLSVTQDGMGNELIVEEGELPVELAKIKILQASADNKAEARQEVKILHDELPIDGGVVAWGLIDMDMGRHWVAAYRTKGMAIEPPLAENSDNASLKQRVVARAVSEWEWWKQLGKKEDSDEGSERVRIYWLEGAKVSGISGKDTDKPWSAAFISYLMEKEGAGQAFKESRSHQVYIYEAIKARRNSDKNYGYWAYELNERKPEAGDLICAWRETKDHKTPVTLVHAATGAWYPSHCDIVVEVAANKIITIGGNVSNMVGKKEFQLNNGGFLTAANFDKGFAILGCQFSKENPKSMPSDSGSAPVASGKAADFLACSDGWEITGYYTPVETDYSSETEEIVITAFGNESFAKTFLKAVKMEGWGKTRFGWYLGYYSGAYHKAGFAKDARGNPLRIGSVAVDRNEIPLGRQLTIPGLPGNWGEMVYIACDVGGMINSKHIDVYCGEGKGALNVTKKVTINKKSANYPNLARVCFA